jgi:hypothetical protein
MLEKRYIASFEELRPGQLDKFYMAGGQADANIKQDIFL